MQQGRTTSAYPYQFIIQLGDPHQYQSISPEARKLFQEGLSYARIAKMLGVTDKTAKKAIVRG